jgi:hypothetical protein
VTYPNRLQLYLRTKVNYGWIAAIFILELLVLGRAKKPSGIDRTFFYYEDGIVGNIFAAPDTDFI